MATSEYADLNVLLAELVASVRQVLDRNFCGAYLQGSFALGDADEHSDVDFIVVTEPARSLGQPLQHGVVRWTLREHGIVLAGPDPKTLVEPVSAHQVRSEVRVAMGEWAEWAPEPTKAGGMSSWKQQLLVLSFCRMLHTLDTGEVTSKRKAGECALGALDAEWIRPHRACARGAPRLMAKGLRAR